MEKLSGSCHKESQSSHKRSQALRNKERCSCSTRVTRNVLRKLCVTKRAERTHGVGDRRVGALARLHSRGEPKRIPQMWTLVDSTRILRARVHRVRAQLAGGDQQLCCVADKE